MPVHQVVEDTPAGAVSTVILPSRVVACSSTGTAATGVVIASEPPSVILPGGEVAVVELTSTSDFRDREAKHQATRAC